MSSNLFGVPQQGGGGVTIEYAFVAGVTQTNLNNNPVQFRPVTYNAGSLQTNMAGVTAANNEIQGLPAGIYLVTMHVRLFAFSARTNLDVRPRVNGIVQNNLIGESGYIRSASGHNESTIHVMGYLDLPASANLGMSAQREAGGGLVFTTGGLSQMGALRIA